MTDELLKFQNIESLYSHIANTPIRSLAFPIIASIYEYQAGDEKALVEKLKPIGTTIHSKLGVKKEGSIPPFMVTVFRRK